MPWDTKQLVHRRLEFVTLAKAGGIALCLLCRRFGISRKTAYKWLRRFDQLGLAGLADQPRSSPRWSNQTSLPLEAQILSLRADHPTWGPRKLHRRLQDLGGHPPAVSTIGRLLKRSGCITAEAATAHRPCQRFERAEPNELWQMDFKGHFALQSGRCHPLTVLDDCTRYLLGLRACADEQARTVQAHLRELFRDHGLPACVLCDNGPPWSGSGHEHTALSVWLLRLGVRVIHGRPFHPQTQGKDERFHRTLQADLLARHDWPDLTTTQQRFDAFRQLYNHDRPHEALALAVPASRYRSSARSLPAQLPVPAYDNSELLRTVKSKGEITFANRFYYIGKAFHGLTLALRPTAQDGLYRVCLAAITLGVIDCAAPSTLPKGCYHQLLRYPQKV